MGQRRNDKNALLWDTQIKPSKEVYASGMGTGKMTQ
jgi:hypothetical protein